MTLSDVLLVQFGDQHRLPSDVLVRVAERLHEIVGLELHGKQRGELDPKEVTVRVQAAENGSISGYYFEVTITLDHPDYPFADEQFRAPGSPEATQACEEKAKAVWEALEGTIIEKPYLVWVLAGHISGYYDGDTAEHAA